MLAFENVAAPAAVKRVPGSVRQRIPPPLTLSVPLLMLMLETPPACDVSIAYAATVPPVMLAWKMPLGPSPHSQVPSARIELVPPLSVMVQLASYPALKPPPVMPAAPP